MFEVFASLLMKVTVFWDMTVCWLAICYRRFGGTCRFPATYSSSVSLKMGAAVFSDMSVTN
jgi:hypothetical protein